MTEKCLIFIINWQQCDETKHLLINAKFDTKLFDIFIFDNEASASTAAFFSENQSIYTHYQGSSENYGFAKACNIGLDFAIDHGYEFIFFLNNDLIIDNENAETILHNLSECANVALASPLIRDIATHEITFCGATLNIQTTLINHCDLLAIDDNIRNHHFLLYGTALLGRTQLIKQAGGFFEPFFAYWEDFLLSYRLIELGYSCAVIKAASVFHQNDRSQEKHTIRSKYYYYYLTRNEVIFWRNVTKNLNFVRPIYWLFRRSLNTCCMLFKATAYQQIFAITQGFIDGCFGNAGKWKHHPIKKH